MTDIFLAIILGLLIGAVAYVFLTDTFLTIILGLLIGAVAYAFLSSMAIPDVWISYSTDECVKVINYVEGDNYSCENMPSKFNHVWVK